MAETMEPSASEPMSDEPYIPGSTKTCKPCPLCCADIELWEQYGPQAVVCGSCGLSCSIDASPRQATLDAALLESMVDVPPAVEHWLEHAPHPVPPELTPQGRRARRRRIAGYSAAVVFAIAMAGVASFASYQQANQQASLRLAEQRSQARENENHLLALKQRVERQRYHAEQRQAAAERQARLMTARLLAAQAADVSTSRPWQGVAAAIGAVNATLLQDGFVAAEAHQSLRDAVANCSPAYGIDGTSLRGHRGAITSLAASPDGRWLASGGADHAVHLWNLQAGEPGRSSSRLKKHAAPVTHAVFSSDGRWLVTASDDSMTCLWDLAGDVVATGPVILPGRGAPVSKIAMSPDGRWLAIVFTGVNGEAETARLWNLSAGPQQATSLELNGHAGQIQAVAMSPDSRWLAISVNDTVHLWNLAARVPAIASVGRQCGHGGVTAALFTNDGKWLVTSGRDGAIRLWNLLASDPSTSIVLRGRQGPLRIIATSRDSRWLVTAGQQRRVLVWDLSAVNPSVGAHTLSLAAGPITAAAISFDGRWLAVGAATGVHLWAMDGNGPAEPAVWLPGSEHARRLVFAADSHWLAAAGASHVLRVWNVDIHDLMNRASSVAAARKRSLAVRYAWLDFSDTPVGKVARQQVDGALWATAWNALERPLDDLRLRAATMVSEMSRRWAHIRPQMARRLDSRAAARPSAPTPLPSTAGSEAAPPAAAPQDKTRYVIPRHATQGNTLRLYVR